MASTVKNWTVDRLPSLTGRRYLITGANAGLGLEASKQLRAAGADLIMAARNPAKGTAAKADVLASSGNGSVELVEMDLADTSSIRAGADAVRALAPDGLDAVINNAGIMQTPQRETADGFELQFGTNHLGHFLLNQLLFDLVAARRGRIVPVASMAHLRGKLHFDDLMLRDDYSPTTAYCQSKLANLMYGLELARRLDAAGSEVISASAHPGYANTNLQSTGPEGLLKSFYKISNRLVAQPAHLGAMPEVLAAAGDEARNGAYYGPTWLMGSRGPIGESHIAKQARNEADAARLWDVSEELLGIEFRVS